MAKEDYWRRALKTLRLKQRRSAGKLDLGAFNILGSDRALDEAVDARIRFARDVHRESEAAALKWRREAAARRDRLITASAEQRAFLQSDEQHAAAQMAQVRAIDAEMAATEKRYAQESLNAKNAALYRYAEYARYVGNIDAFRSKQATGRGLSGDSSQLFVSHGLDAHYNSMQHTPDRAGYRRYLRSVAPQFFNQVLDRKVRAYVSAANHGEHTYVVGTTKSGKSELLKAYIHALMQNDDASVLFLDPSGDAAQQIARWPEHRQSDRLIYIDIGLSQGYVPTINPFDADRMSDDDKIVLTQQIVGAFAEILGGELGSALSVNMRAILIPSVRLLLDLPGTSLRDLQRLMNDDPELLRAGRQSPHDVVSAFFNLEFNKAGYGQTKHSIAAKIASILTTGMLERLICGRSTIDLEDALANKRIVVCNLAQGRLGEDEARAFGKLLIALVQGIGMRRERLPRHARPMTHLVVDECQKFITPSIIKIIEETRKYGLAVTLAQLAVGRGMSDEMAHVVSTIPNAYIVGRAGEKETKRSSALVGVDPADIANLEIGQFFYKAGTAPAFLLYGRSDLVDWRHRMSTDDWHEVRMAQRARFYRKIDGDQERDEAPASAGVDAPRNASQVKRKTRRKLV